MNYLLNLIVLIGLMTCSVHAGVGHMGLVISSATLDSTVNGQAYVKVCVQNSTHPYQTPLQIRTECVDCTSPLASPGNKPAWYSICYNIKDYKFSDHAQIIFEVWEHQNKDNFVGSSSITIRELLAKNKNFQTFNLTLNSIEDKKSGSLKSLILWIQESYVDYSFVKN